MKKPICKYCGCEGQAGGGCVKSPTKRHELAVMQDQYMCKYCGRTGFPTFAGGGCVMSPTGKHVLAG